MPPRVPGAPPEVHPSEGAGGGSLSLGPATHSQPVHEMSSQPPWRLPPALAKWIDPSRSVDHEEALHRAEVAVLVRLHAGTADREFPRMAGLDNKWQGWQQIVKRVEPAAWVGLADDTDLNGP